MGAQWSRVLYNLTEVSSRDKGRKIWMQDIEYVFKDIRSMVYTKYLLNYNY